MMIHWEPLKAPGGGSSGPSAAEIAAAVWSEPMAGYTSTTTFGGFMRTILTVAKFLGLK